MENSGYVPIGQAPGDRPLGELSTGFPRCLSPGDRHRVTDVVDKVIVCALCNTVV